MHLDNDRVEQLTGELANFEEIAKYLIPQPGDLPRLKGIDIYGGTVPLNGVVGGDHLIYVDFKQRFDLETRIPAGGRRGETGGRRDPETRALPGRESHLREPAFSSRHRQSLLTGGNAAVSRRAPAVRP